MSDYSIDCRISRGEMASALSDNEEHLVYVLSEALWGMDMDYAIELGSLPDEIVDDEPSKKQLVDKLRRLADAVENGEVT